MTHLSAAEQLLVGLGVESPTDIDVEAIAWERGAEVCFAPLESCEARIIGYGDRAVITIREDSRWPRQRFSIAHELGHWHWHRGRSFICRSDDIGNYARDPLDPERVADEHAVDLLMPAFLFRPLMARLKKLNFETIDEIRQPFQTSRTAATLRTIALSSIPAMLVCHGPKGRKWFRAGPDVPRRWFPLSELDAESSAMDVVFGSAEKTRMQVIGADAWFDCRGSDRHEVFEQTVKTANGDALTLIVFKDEAMLD